MKIQDDKHKTAWSVFLTCIIFASIIHSVSPTCTYCFMIRIFFCKVLKEGRKKIPRGRSLTVGLRKALESSSIHEKMTFNVWTE